MSSFYNKILKTSRRNLIRKYYTEPPHIRAAYSFTHLERSPTNAIRESAPMEDLSLPQRLSDTFAGAYTLWSGCLCFSLFIYSLCNHTYGIARLRKKYTWAIITGSTQLWTGYTWNPHFCPNYFIGHNLKTNQCHEVNAVPKL